MTNETHFLVPAVDHSRFKAVLEQLYEANLEALHEAEDNPVPRPADTHTSPRRYDPPRTSKQDPR